jgi:hypothetical protein
VRLITTRQTQTVCLWIVGLFIVCLAGIVVFDILAVIVRIVWPLIVLGVITAPIVLPAVWIARRHVSSEGRPTNRPTDQPRFRIRGWMIGTGILLVLMVVGLIGEHVTPVPVQSRETAIAASPVPTPVPTPSPYIFPQATPYISPNAPVPLAVGKGKEPKLRLHTVKCALHALKCLGL